MENSPVLRPFFGLLKTLLVVLAIGLTLPATAKPSPTPLEILGVSATMTAREIRSAYMKLVKEYHPDSPKNLDLSEAEQKSNNLRLQEITAAYDEVKKILDAGGSLSSLSRTQSYRRAYTADVREEEDKYDPVTEFQNFMHHRYQRADLSAHGDRFQAFVRMFFNNGTFVTPQKMRDISRVPLTLSVGGVELENRMFAVYEGWYKKLASEIPFVEKWSAGVAAFAGRFKTESYGESVVSLLGHLASYVKAAQESRDQETIQQQKKIAEDASKAMVDGFETACGMKLKDCLFVFASRMNAHREITGIMSVSAKKSLIALIDRVLSREPETWLLSHEHFVILGIRQRMKASLGSYLSSAAECAAILSGDVKRKFLRD